MEFQNIDLVWSGLAAIGSLLLAGNLTGKAMVGAYLIFSGFVIQALWNSYNTLGLSAAIGVSVIVIAGLVCGLRKKICKKS